jgi:BlaI family penicillinase repressor
VYVPQITQEACLRAQSETFLELFFSGSVKPLLQHFVREQRLSKKDLAELRRMLDKGETK